MEPGMGPFDSKSPSMSHTGSKRNSHQGPSSVEFEDKQLHLHDKMDSALSWFTGHMDSMTAKSILTED